VHSFLMSNNNAICLQGKSAPAQADRYRRCATLAPKGAASAAARREY
jgi:hypothetical protein